MTFSRCTAGNLGLRYQSILYSIFVKYLCVAVSNVRCPRVADVVLAIDQSTSILAGNQQHSSGYMQILRFAKSIAAAFSISDKLTQVGLFKFNNSTEIVFHLNRYGDRRSLLSAIDNVVIHGGDTNIAAALRVARQMFSRSNGARPGVPKILIMLTDGVANSEELRTLDEAELTKAADVEIFVVGVTHLVDEDELRAIASQPDYYFFASNFAHLDNVIPHLVETSCKEAATLPTTTTSLTTRMQH